ncbi:thioredoxin family protein [Flavobacteriaceae bacterium]|nr:thioredoxin family protein [Flavobacteriaceae bacterium]
MSLIKAQIESAIKVALDYPSYMILMQELVLKEMSTGLEQSDALANYTLLNNKRMQRLNKTLKIPSEIETSIKNDPRDIHFLVLSESWCGDAAQSLPMVSKIAKCHPNWSMSIVSRDEHPVIMDAYLTNGGRSIPKVLILDNKTLEVLADWGPRPTVATKMVVDYKEIHGALDADFKQSLQLWYNKDKGQSTLQDFLILLGL